MVAMSVLSLTSRTVLGISSAPTQHAEPATHFRNGFVHASSELGFYLVQLRLQSFANRLSQNRETPFSRLAADMRKAEEVKRSRFLLPALLPVFGRKPSEFQKPRFLGMQLQLELPKSLGEFRPEPLGIRFHLESNHTIIGISHDNDIALRLLLTPLLNPQVDYVMEV